MSRTVNRVTLVGNCGQEPECRTTAGGTKVAKFSLATTHRFKGKGDEWQEKTDWHRVTAFGKTADVVEQYVGKGHRLYIDGRIEYSQTEGEDGKPRYWTDIIVNELVMLDNKKEVDPF